MFVKLDFGGDHGPLFVNPDHVVAVRDYRADETPEPWTTVWLRDQPTGWLVSGTAEEVVDKLDPPWSNLPIQLHG